MSRPYAFHQACICGSKREKVLRRNRKKLGCTTTNHRWPVPLSFYFPLLYASRKGRTFHLVFFIRTLSNTYFSIFSSPVTCHKRRKSFRLLCRGGIEHHEIALLTCPLRRFRSIHFIHVCASASVCMAVWG